MENPVLHHMNKIQGDFAVLHQRGMKIPQWTFEKLTSATSRTSNSPDLAGYFGPSSDPITTLGATSVGSAVENTNQQWSTGQTTLKKNYMDNHVHYNLTAVVTNIAPMDKTLHDGLWVNVEDFQQQLAKSYSVVSVFTGPIFEDRTERKSTGTEDTVRTAWSPQVSPAKKSTTEASRKVQEFVGPNGNLIIVPTSFFKVIVCQKNDHRIMDFWFLEIPNISLGKDCNVMDYTTDLRTINAKTRLKFLKNLREDKEKGIVQFGSCNGKPCPDDIINFRNKASVTPKKKQLTVSPTERAYNRLFPSLSPNK